MQTKQRKAASLKPSEFGTGGLIDNVRAVVAEAVYSYFDYAGKGNRTFAAKIVLTTDEGESHEQYYSAGAAEAWSPSPDGQYAIPQGSQDRINDNTNLAILIKQMINAGFPEDRIGDSIGVLKGLYALWQRQAAPERAGLANRPPAAGANANRTPTILVPTQIINLPWQEQKSPALAANQGSGSPSSPSAAPGAPAGAPVAAPPIQPVTGTSTPASDGVTAKARDFIFSQVTSNGGQADRAAIARNVITSFQGDPDMSAIAQLVFQPNFIEGIDGLTLEGSTVKLG